MQWVFVSICKGWDVCLVNGIYVEVIMVSFVQ